MRRESTGETLDLNPALYEAQLALGQMLTRTGNGLEARANLEKAAQSNDPDVRQAALKALR